MKMSKILSLVLAVLMLVACLASCTGGDESEASKNASNAGTTSTDTSKDASTDASEESSVDMGAALAGTYDITLWVSEKEGVADLTKEQINAFMAAYPGIVINAQVEGVAEGDAGSRVVADVASAPDIFCFAQDQLARLVQAAALAAPGQNAQQTIKDANDTGSVNAATVAGTIYAYPLTSDNGYYMYYNKSIISEEDAKSMEKLIAACEANELKFRYALENAWYTASFFFATGCKSNWSMNEAGEFTSVDDTFNSEAGLIAMKGMQKLAKSSAYDSNADVFVDAGVIVTGIWNAEAAQAHFGDDFAAAALPSFEVDGKSYQLGSFSGYKLMGVKPQTDAKKGAVLSLLAQYLTNEDCQKARYEKFQWGPSNKAAQETDAVKSNASLIALNAQNQFAIPQGQIHGSWWDIAKVLGADAKAATSDADLQTALDNYKKSVDALLTMTEDQKKAWGVIGNICGSNWDTDFAMTEDPAGTFTSDVLELKAGDQFKVRQGASWDVNFGQGFNGANIVVETDGKYKVQLVWDGAQEGTVTLIPAE
ncbi:MAG: extracellular solute-binding protein [Ruminococcaceae bacterium]|nr:extracellular solute-binding protein [Oscillospiraceae bacterium]